MIFFVHCSSHFDEYLLMWFSTHLSNDNCQALYANLKSHYNIFISLCLKSSILLLTITELTTDMYSTNVPSYSKLQSNYLANNCSRMLHGMFH